MGTRKSRRDTGAQMSPLKRVGTPRDIADAVAFVVTEEAWWLTGQNIPAGGGVVMRWLDEGDTGLRWRCSLVEHR